MHLYPHTRTYRVYKYIQMRYHIYISREMCVFNREMVDSGTIGFIASQEMARKQGGGAGSLAARGPGGFKQQHCPRITLAAPPCRSQRVCSARSSGTGRLGGTQSDASLAPSQAGNGCREFFCGKFGITHRI